MTRRPASIEVADYHDEITQFERTRSADYYPATANEPRRVLTHNGRVLTGSNNGQGRADWSHCRTVIVHTAVTVAGAELSSLVDVTKVDERLSCERPACRALRAHTSVPVPAQSPPTERDRVT